jgi:lysophospholipase L1-like esterase
MKPTPLTIVLVLLGLSLGFFLIRTQLLLKASDKLFKEASKYTTSYTIGSGENTLVVTVLGDSTAAGVGSGRLEDSYPYLVSSTLVRTDRKVTVHVLAKSGARIADMVNDQIPSLSALHPDLVLLSIGANDATHFTDTAAYANDVAIAKQAFSQGNYFVIWATTPDVSYIPALPAVLSSQMNKRAQNQNASLLASLPAGRIYVADLYHEAVLDSSKDSGLYAADSFHPSAKGYRLWAASFDRALIKTGLTD